MNETFLDAMSLVHVGVGSGFRLFRVPLWATVIIAVAWEIVEHVLKTSHPRWFVFPSQDSLPNSIGDVLCAVVGWGLAGLISGANGRRRAHRTGQ